MIEPRDPIDLRCVLFVNSTYLYKIMVWCVFTVCRCTSSGAGWWRARRATPTTSTSEYLSTYLPIAEQPRARLSALGSRLTACLVRRMNVSVAGSPAHAERAAAAAVLAQAPPRAAPQPLPAGGEYLPTCLSAPARPSSPSPPVLTRCFCCSGQVSLPHRQLVAVASTAARCAGVGSPLGYSTRAGSDTRKTHVMSCNSFIESRDWP